MSSHSQFKRFNILQELEQAIKKKTHEKYKSKSKTKPIQIKPAKTPILEKPSVGVTRKSTQVVQQSAKTKCVDFKVKKYQNKKFDKVVSLINYTITSADKALKYVNLSSNFEAEFAYKLYLSDRENLMNELNNLNLQEITSSISPLSNYPQSVEMKALQSNQYSNIEIHSLKNENDKLRKEIMIMEGEMKKFKQREQETKHNIPSPIVTKADQQKQDILKRQIDVKQIQVNKLSDLLKRICNFTEIYDYLDLVEKEMKYRSVLASAGLSGFELNRIQRDELERNLVSIDGKISQLEGLMINKMEKLAQGEDEQVLEELQSINKLLHRKIAPILKENQSQSLQNKKISEIISMYVNYSAKKERELLASNEKMEGKLIDYIQMAKQFEKKDSSAGQKIEQATKENQLLKSNLKDIYEELKGLLSDNLRKNGYTDSSDVTFETLLKQIELLIIKNGDTKILEKKVKQLSQEDSRKTALATKQNSILKKMQQDLNEIRTRLQQSEDKKHQAQEYVLILQKKKKDDDKVYDEMRMKFEHLEKELQESESLIQEKQTMIRRLQDELIYTKSDIQKLNALIESKDHQITERQDMIHERQSKIDRLVHESNNLRDEISQLNSNLQVEVEEKNKILEHLRFMEDRLKESEGHLETITEESNEKCREMHNEMERLESLMRQAQGEKNRYENMYINIMETNKSQETRRLRAIESLQRENNQLREKNDQLIQIQQSMQEKLTHLSQSMQEQQQSLTQSNESQKQQLLQQLSTLQQQLHELKEQNKSLNESNQKQRLAQQQGMSSQQDMLQEINNKEEMIIKLQRQVDEINQEAEEKARAIEQLEGKVQAYSEHQLKMEQQLRELTSQIEIKTKQLQTKIANEQFLTQQLQDLQQQLQQLQQQQKQQQQQFQHHQQQQSINQSPQKSQMDSLAYEQQIKIQQLEEKLTQTMTEIGNKNSEIQGLKNQLSSKLSQFELLQQKVYQLQLEIEENQQQENQLIKKKQTELQILATKQQQLSEKYQEIEEKLQSLMEKQQQLQQRQTELEQRDQQLLQKQQQIQHKVLELKDKQAQVQKLALIQNQKAQELKNKQIAIEQKLEEIETIEQEIQQKINQAKMKQEQAQRKLFEIQRKEHELFERQDLLQQQKEAKYHEEQQNEQQQQEKQALISRCHQLQQNISTLKDESTQLNQQIQTLTTTLNTTEQNLSIKQQQLNILTNELSKTQQQIQAFREQEEQLRQTVNLCEEKITLLQRKVDQLTDVNKQLVIEKELLEQKVEELSVELVDVRKGIKNELLEEQREEVKQDERNSEQLIRSIQSGIKEDNQLLQSSPIVKLSPINSQRSHQTEEEEQQQQQQFQHHRGDSYSDQQPQSSNNAYPTHQATATTTTIQLIQTKYKKLILQLKEQLQQTQSQTIQVKHSHALLEERNNELLLHIQNIQRQKFAIIAEVENLRQVATKRMQQNDRLNEVIINMKQSFELETKKLVNQYQELHLIPLQQKLNQKEQQIQKLNQNYQQLQSTLQQTKTTKEEYIEALESKSIIKEEEYTKKVEELKQEVDQGRLRGLEMEQENVRVRENCVQMESKLQQLNQQIQHINEHHLKSLTNLTTQLSLLKQQNQLISTRASTLQLTGEIKLRELKYENITLTTEIQTLNDQIFYLKKELEEKRLEEIERKEELAVHSNEVVEELKAKLEQNNEKLIDTNTLLQEANNNIRTLQHKLEQQSQTNTQLQQQIEDLNQTITKLQAQIQSLELQKDSNNDQKNSLLKDKDTELMQKDILLVKSEQRIQELQYKLREKDQRMQELTGEIEKLKEELLKEKEKVNSQEQQSFNKDEGNEIDQFGDIKQQNEVQQARFQNFLAKNFTAHLHAEKQQQQQQSSQLQKVEHQITQHKQLPHRDFFDEFDQMSERKVDDSMVSNDATEERGEQYYARETKIIETQYLTQDHPHHAYSQPAVNHQQYQHQQPQTITISKNHQHSQQQHLHQSTTAQDFGQFQDIKSSLINSSVPSNKTQDNDQEQDQIKQQQLLDEKQKEEENILVKKDSLRASKNMVDPHQDKQHSEGSYSGQRAIQHQYKSQQDQSEEHQHEHKENESESEQKAHENDLDEFDEMGQQKMSQSMMSNQPQPTEQRQIIHSVLQQSNILHQNIIQSHEDRQHSQGSALEYNQKNIKLQQIQQQQPQIYFKSQTAIPATVEAQQQKLQQSQDQQQQGQQFEQFDEMKSQHMNDSMMSDVPQPPQIEEILKSSRQLDREELLHPHKSEEHSEGVKSNEEQSLSQQQQKDEQKQQEHQQQQKPQAEGQQLDQFDEMKSQKMNASMMSNQPQPAQSVGLPQQPTHKVPQHHNIVSAHQDIQHSEGSQVHQYQIDYNDSKSFDIQPQVKVKQTEQPQQQQSAQNFNQFDDMKSEKMNASMLSNQPEPSEHREFFDRNAMTVQKNIVSIHEERQHSEGVHDNDQEKEEQSSQEQEPMNDIKLHKRPSSAQNSSHLLKDQQQQQRREQYDEENRDFDEFDDMKSQKMNASIISNEPQRAEIENYSNQEIRAAEHKNIVDSHEEKQHSDELIQHNKDFDQSDEIKSQKMMDESMTSNEPQPTENPNGEQEEIDEYKQNEDYQKDMLQHHKNLVQTHVEINVSNNVCRSQYQYHTSEIKDIQIHKALPSANIPEEDIDVDAHKILQERMNESMMSNQPEASEKLQINQQSQDEEDHKQLQKSHVFEHNLVIVSRVSQANRKDDGQGYIHDGRSERGNLNARLDEDVESDQQKDVVDVQKKKTIVIQTQHHEYRSQYELGYGEQPQKRDEDFPLQDRQTRVKYSQSIASNQAQVNDIGGNFINCYALQNGKYNKIEKNLIQYHHQCEQRSERNLEVQWSQSSDKRNNLEFIDEEEKHHYVARSQYSSNVKKVALYQNEKEQQQKSQSMIEAKDDEEDQYTEEQFEQQAVDQQHEQEDKEEQLKQDSDRKYLQESGFQSQSQVKLESSDAKEQSPQQKEKQMHMQISELQEAMSEQSQQEKLSQSQEEKQKQKQEQKKQQESFYSQHGEDHHHLSQQLLSSHVGGYLQSIYSSIKPTPNKEEQEQQHESYGQKIFENISGVQLQLDQKLVKDISPYQQQPSYQQHEQQQRKSLLEIERQQRQHQQQQSEEKKEQQQLQQNNQYNSQLIQDMEDDNQVMIRHHLEVVQTEQKVKDQDQQQQDQEQSQHQQQQQQNDEQDKKEQQVQHHNHPGEQHKEQEQPFERMLDLHIVIDKPEEDIDYIGQSHQHQQQQAQNEDDMKYLQDDDDIKYLKDSEQQQQQDQHELLHKSVQPATGNQGQKEQVIKPQQQQQEQEYNDDFQVDYNENEDGVDGNKDQQLEGNQQQQLQPAPITTINEAQVPTIIAHAMMNSAGKIEDNYQQEKSENKPEHQEKGEEQLEQQQHQQKQEKYSDEQYEQQQQEDLKHIPITGHKQQQLSLLQNEQQQLNDSEQQQNLSGDYQLAQEKDQEIKQTQGKENEQQYGQHKDQHQQQAQKKQQQYSQLESQEQDSDFLNQQKQQQLQHQQGKYQDEEQLQQQQQRQTYSPNDQNNFSDFNDMIEQKMGDSMISNQQQHMFAQHQGKQQEQYDGNNDEQILQKESPNKGPQNRNDSLHSHKSEDANNFSQFNEMENEQMSASMMSNQQQHQHEHEEQQQVLHQQHLLSQSKPNEPIKSQAVDIDDMQQQQQSNDQNNFSDFNDMTEQKMGHSMMSNNQQQYSQQHQSTEKCSESFAKLIEQHYNEHQISQINKKQDNEHHYGLFEKSKLSEGNEFDAFNSIVEEKVDGSMMSQKEEDNNKEFDAFNSMTEEKIDGSMVSQNEDKNLDWFGNQGVNEKSPLKNQKQAQQQNEQQGFSDFKDYESHHMSQSQSQVQQPVQPTYFRPHQHALKLNQLQQKQQHHHDEVQQTQKILPIDILLTSERRRQELRQRQQQDDEEENYNTLLQFLPSTSKKSKKPIDNNESQDAEIEGKDTNRSNSFNEDDFQFKIRKSVQSIDSKMDIFENFNNNSGSVFSEQAEFKGSEVVKPSEEIKTLKKGQSAFTFSQVMENENESSYQSNPHQQDDDFDQFMIQSNMPAPSPVNKTTKPQSNNFFDFENAGNEAKQEDRHEDKEYFDYFE